MSIQKKANAKHFWLVVLGLFLLIGLIAGGTYVLDAQGLISAGSGGEQGGSRGEPPAGMADFAASGEMPTRPDHDGGEGGFSVQALSGVLQEALQIGLVVVVVAGGQWLFSWLMRRRRHVAAV